MAIDDHFDRRKQKKPHGTQAERKTSARLGTRLKPGSGSMEGAKGDMESRDWLIENKATVKASMGVKKDWLEKIAREATEVGKAPALAIQFVDAHGNSKPDDRWVMVREVDFQGLTE